MPKAEKQQADYILPLYMNGLAGRMLRLPAPKGKRRELLIIYGHHASIERMEGLAVFLNKYGTVTLPDLPGFGGMQSFYKIGKKPTIDNMADYLAAFIKLRYRNKRLSIAGVSYGFLVVTRMLQKNPDLVKKIDLVFSFAGFVHYQDFRFKKSTFYTFKYLTPVLSMRIPATFIRYCLFQGPIIKTAYKLVEGKHEKIRDVDEEERKRRINFEVKLWQINDVRTYMSTARSMFTVNLCNAHVELPIYHISVNNDRYFNNVLVEQHMRAIFTDFELEEANVPTHAASVIATAKEAEPYVTPKVRRLLNKKA